MSKTNTGILCQAWSSQDPHQHSVVDADMPGQSLLAAQKLLQVRRHLMPGRWHNGSVFVFCPGDCPFKSEPSPTSAHACEEVTGCMLATKRSACVAPEMDLGECTLHLPPHKAQGFETQRRHHQKSKTGVPVASKKRTCVRQKL